jgi:hypothetical protein
MPIGRPPHPAPPGSETPGTAGVVGRHGELIGVLPISTESPYSAAILKAVVGVVGVSSAFNR